MLRVTEKGERERPSACLLFPSADASIATSGSSADPDGAYARTRCARQVMCYCCRRRRRLLVVALTWTIPFVCQVWRSGRV